MTRLREALRGFFPILALAAVTPAAFAAITPTSVKLVTQNQPTQFDDPTLTYATSSNGRYVAISTSAGNVVPGVVPSHQQIFWLDRKTGARKLVSKSSSGQPANSHCFEPKISDDGKKIVFLSASSNLGQPANGKEQVHYADLTAGTITILSKDPQGNLSSLRSWSLNLSGDGLVATFTNDAPNMMPSLPVMRRVFAYDWNTGTLDQVSVASNGQAANAASNFSDISRDGRFVAFETDATNLVAENVTGTKVVVRDRKKDTTVLVSKSASGAIPNSECYGASISADGRFVSFISFATNLTPEFDTQGTQDAFVVDRALGKVWKISCGLISSLFEFTSDTEISNDGRRVAILTTYKNPFLANATMLRARVFDRVAKTSTIVEPAGPASNVVSDSVNHPVLCGSGKKMFFVSSSAKLGVTADQQLFMMKFEDL